MYEQNKLLRSNALGDFSSLLLGISRDPAMLRWLDNNTNRRTSPNENYARELMELFTMGVGNYTENDVREAARAFTGWSFDRESGFGFNRNQHDFGDKTFLGSTGPWNGDDIIDIILRQPATATFIATKVFTFLAHDHPAPSTVARLAQGFRSSGYSIRELVRSIFLSPEFSSAEAYHATVRSPVEYLVGSLKLLNIDEMAPSIAGSLRRMGMDLYNPPDVAGWNWGVAWIGTATLLERLNAASAWTTQRGTTARYGADPVALLRRTGARTSTQLVDQLLDLLVEGDVSDATRQALLGYASAGYRGRDEDFTSDPQHTDRVVRGLIHLILSTPAYQMA